MKNERLYTALCAAGISFCLGLGAVGAMATGLGLPVEPAWLILWCAVLAAVITGLSCLNGGSLLSLGVLSVFLLNADVWTELKTVAATVAEKLYLAYGIPIPEMLSGELSESVVAALSLCSGLITVAAVWAVQKKKTVIPAAALSLLPLTGCITVVDTVPNSVWLFFWGFGLVLLLMTQWARTRSDSRANRLTVLLALPTAMVLLCLFWLIPRDAPDRWRIAELPSRILSYFTGPAEGESAIPGPPAPPKVDLSALEERRREQTPVMEVIADFTGPLYLRAQDYDEYTGTGWQSTEGRTEELYGFNPQYHLKDGAVKLQVRQPRDYYFLPAVTQDLKLVKNGKAENPDREVDYQFDHCSLREDWKDYWPDSEVCLVNPRYLDLPEDTNIQAWTYLSNQQELLQAMLDNLSVPDQAELIAEHLRNHASYDLSTPNMPETEQDLALWFLNKAETGYCVHYATAATVLLRANGIPARYVEGYAVYVEKGRTVTVRELHAHAWAEYYVNGVGWLVLEATPEDGTAPEEPVTTEPTQTEPVTTTAPTEPNAATTAPNETEPTVTDESRKPLPGWIKPLLLVIIWTCAAVLLLWGQYRLRRRLFVKAICCGDPNHRALVIYRRLRRLSKWTGRSVSPVLTQLAQKARFSPHTLTPEELSQLRDGLKQSESAAARLSLVKRLTAKWLFAYL